MSNNLRLSRIATIIVSVIVLVFLLTLLQITALATCGYAESQGVDFAEQSEFLADMANGINQRLASDTEDSSSMEWEELLEYYHSLVQIELNEIEKYDALTFADEKFDRLAHAYIDACKMQLLASENVRNRDLYNGLWNGAYTARCGIIVTMYDRYDLPLSAAAVDNYRAALIPYETYSIQVEDVQEASLSEVDTSAAPNYGTEGAEFNSAFQITASALNMSDSYLDEDPMWYSYSFTVLNASGKKIDNLYIDSAISDADGNILGTTQANIVLPIANGKTIVMKSRAEVPSDIIPCQIVPLSIWYTDENYDLFSFDVDEASAQAYSIWIGQTAEPTPEPTPEPTLESTPEPTQEGTNTSYAGNENKEHPGESMPQGFAFEGDSERELIVEPEFSLFGIRFGDNISTIEKEILEKRKGFFAAMDDETYEAMKDYGTIWLLPGKIHRIFDAEINSLIFTCKEDLLGTYGLSSVAIRFEKGKEAFANVKAELCSVYGAPVITGGDALKGYTWQPNDCEIRLEGALAYTELNDAENGAELFELNFEISSESAGQKENEALDNALPMPDANLEGVFSIRDGIQFGDSMEVVREKERLELAEVTNEDGEVYLQAEGVDISKIKDSVLSYYFDEAGRLDKIIMRLNANNTSHTQLEDDYSLIKSSLIRKYGDPVHSTNGDDDFISEDRLTGHGLYVVFETTKLLAAINGNTANLDYEYNQWYFRDADGIVLIEQLAAYLGGNSNTGPIAMHYVNYYRFDDELSEVQDARIRAAQAEIDTDL